MTMKAAATRRHLCRLSHRLWYLAPAIEGGGRESSEMSHRCNQTLRQSAFAATSLIWQCFYLIVWITQHKHTVRITFGRIQLFSYSRFQSCDLENQDQG